MAVVSAGSMQVCTSLQTDNHASTHHSVFLQAGRPSCRPTNSVKALEGKINGLKINVFQLIKARKKKTIIITIIERFHI